MVEWLRAYCLSFPKTTESVQWGDSLVFKVAGKVFAIAALEPRQHVLSVKCAPEKFAEAVERPGIVPAPYLGRAKWIALEQDHTLTRGEVAALVKDSYELVFAKLPKRVRED